MSVVYHGANDMLHAFKAADGQELWGFVPYDQLGKLRERIRPQLRDPHTYVIATPIRVGDVFVPGPFSKTVGSVTVSGAGVWRTVILFGRGIGGKHVTAIDITSPGILTTQPLDTAPPIVMWNRGNPDTQDGTLAGTVNHDTADYNAYLKMGQTVVRPHFRVRHRGPERHGAPVHRRGVRGLHGLGIRQRPVGGQRRQHDLCPRHPDR